MIQDWEKKDIIGKLVKFAGFYIRYCCFSVLSPDLGNHTMIWENLDEDCTDILVQFFPFFCKSEIILFFKDDLFIYLPERGRAAGSEGSSQKEKQAPC